MSQLRRLLTVEPFEDRFLPSVSIAPVRSFEFASARSNATLVGFQQPARGDEIGLKLTTITGHFFIGDRVFQFRFQFWSGISFGSSNSFDRSESQVGSARSGSQGAKSQSSDESLASASAVSPTAQGRGPLRARAASDLNDAKPAALTLPSEGARPTAAPNNIVSGAPAVMRAELLANRFIPVTANAALLTGRMSYELFGGMLTESGQSVEPPLVPELVQPGTEVPAPPAPEVTASESGLAGILSRLPLAGALPIDVAAVGATAGNFLNRVADLDAEWADDLPEFEDYLWSAAAVLLAGAAIHSAAKRGADRRPRGFAGLDSVLAEWEGSDARRPG